MCYVLCVIAIGSENKPVNGIGDRKQMRCCIKIAEICCIMPISARYKCIIILLQ